MIINTVFTFETPFEPFEYIVVKDIKKGNGYLITGIEPLNHNVINWFSLHKPKLKVKYIRRNPMSKRVLLLTDKEKEQLKNIFRK